MHDDLVLKADLEDILESINIIDDRFKNISSPDDFVTTPFGVTNLDSIAMRIQVIGEIIKNIEKSRTNYLLGHEDIEWNRIIRMRDFISHHYKLINPKIIYDICKLHLPRLKTVIEQIIKEIK